MNIAMTRKPGGRGDDIPQATNTLIIAVQLAATAGCVWGAAVAPNWWTLTLIAIAFAVVLNSIYSIIHEAEHAMLYNNPRLNDTVGAVMAFLFPAPFHLLRQGHIGHHMRNRSDDEAFDLYFEGDNLLWRWLVWIGILTGLYYVLVVASNVIAALMPFVFDRKHFKVERYVAVDRASAAFLEAFNPRYRFLIWLEGVLAIGLHALIVWVSSVPIWHYVALYAAGGFMWSAMQYVHHYGTERHVTRGARNLFIFRPLDAVLLNHNWHLAHHEHPTVPWVHLPKLAEQDGKTDRGFLPTHYLRMWRGIRKATERVKNKYAGRIIR
jgi:fatty acid desaturase